jgi:hypothetical protein
MNSLIEKVEDVIQDAQDTQVLTNKICGCFESN